MYSNILIPIDLEHLDMYPKAIDVARQLFGTEGGKIHSLYVDTNQIHNVMFGQLDNETAEQRRKEMKRRVAKVFEDHVPEALRGSCHIRHGVIYDEILEEEKRIAPDVILIAAGKAGISSYLLGSNAEKVLRHARGNVFVIREGADGKA